jgi:hypothetical protein
MVLLAPIRLLSLVIALDHEQETKTLLSALMVILPLAWTRERSGFRRAGQGLLPGEDRKTYADPGRAQRRSQSRRIRAMGQSRRATCARTVREH